MASSYYGPMSSKERQAALAEILRLNREGLVEEALRVQRSLPADPGLCLHIIKSLGAKVLLAYQNLGFNLYEFEKIYGKDWFSKLK